MEKKLFTVHRNCYATLDVQVVARDEEEAMRMAEARFDAARASEWWFSSPNETSIIGVDALAGKYIDFASVVMLKGIGDDMLLFMKVVGEKSLCVSMDEEDVVSLTDALKNGSEEDVYILKQNLAAKYYDMVKQNPLLAVDIFYGEITDADVRMIDSVNVFKSKQGKLQILAKIAGKDAGVREISQSDWQKIFLAEDMADFKKRLAVKVFKDVIDDERKNGISPLMKQYCDLKVKHPDACLLFRTGDFYETYCEDARKVAKILGITLTRSEKRKDMDGKPLMMAGFPYHALDAYLPKLIRAGQRVAICDQIEVKS